MSHFTSYRLCRGTHRNRDIFITIDRLVMILLSPSLTQQHYPHQSCMDSQLSPEDYALLDDSTSTIPEALFIRKKSHQKIRAC